MARVQLRLKDGEVTDRNVSHGEGNGVVYRSTVVTCHSACCIVTCHSALEVEVNG